MKSSFKHSFLFFFNLLKYFTLLTFPLDPSSYMIAHNDPHISDLMVSHYDYSKQHNLRQFSLTRVQPCAQAPSALKSTRAIDNVSVRSKAKRPKRWTCELCDKFVYAQTEN